FNPSTTIRFSIPDVTSGYNLRHTTLRVYDILGREIAVLVNKEQKPGYYEVRWNAGDLPSGIYFYKLTSGNLVRIKKAVLLK
ncbi:MAG: T9SS type A sorting domain-containing protein, partial [Ignavibacteriaceae bacterium]